MPQKDEGEKLLKDELEKMQALGIELKRELEVERAARQAMEKKLEREEWSRQELLATVGQLYWDVHQMKLEQQIQKEKQRAKQQAVIIQNLREKVGKYMRESKLTRNLSKIVQCSPS